MPAAPPALKKDAGDLLPRPNLGRPKQCVSATRQGAQFLDLGHQRQDDFDPGKIHSARSAQILDTLERADGILAEIDSAVFRVDMRPHQAAPAAHKHQMARHAGKVCGGVDGKNGVGFRRENLQGVELGLHEMRFFLMGAAGPAVAFIIHFAAG